MSPREVLEKHTSRELEEWMAYERVVGPVDSSWDQEVLAQIHELIQFQLDVTLRANGVKKGWKVEPPRRPWDQEQPTGDAPVQTEEQKQAAREEFQRTLEERNRRRGITNESVQASIAAKAK